ncbi:MAG: hypothetical protein AAFO79_10350, partial [Pseudomonadota bacterium]
LDRRLSLYRLPDVLTNQQLTHTMTVPLRADGDTRLYVRVTHEDGHRAWSSPIYLFRLAAPRSRQYSVTAEQGMHHER